MTALDIAQDTIETVASLLERLGGIAPDRVRIKPPLGTATEADLIAAAQRDGHACELVDGVLVEKAMGYGESLLAVVARGPSEGIRRSEEARAGQRRRRDDAVVPRSGPYP